MKHIRNKKLGARSHIKRLQKIRLSVHRSSQHIYAQLVSPEGLILGSASTLTASIKGKVKFGGNIEAAAAVGHAIGQVAKKLGLKGIAFDRSGYLYHGRVKALAEAAREEGIIT